MIRYSLKCAAGHEFESWFRDSAAFESLSAAGHVACAVCGEHRVEKALMAPALGAARPPAPPEAAPRAAHAAGADRKGAGGPQAGPEPGRPAPAPMLSGPAGPVEQALAGLRRFLAENADHVGRDFVTEARRIHLGEARARAIWGEASRDEAKALEEEGIPVAPLPFLARRDD